MKTIRFDDRTPSVMNVKVGNEGDNLAESLRFELPTWLDGAAPSLYLSTGKYSDVILLGADRIYRPTRTHTQHPGRWTAYLEAQMDGDVVWHSDAFALVIGNLPPTGEKVEQAYPTAVEEALKAAAQTVKDCAEVKHLAEQTKTDSGIAAGAAESAERAAQRASASASASDEHAKHVAKDAAKVAQDKQAVEQQVADINASTSRISITAQTLSHGSDATADASISPEYGIRLSVGIPVGAPGKDGVPGKDGKVGPQGAPGADAPQIDDTQASAEHPWSGAKVEEEVNQLKDELSDKLPKSPASWEPWTAEEQAAARERIGALADAHYDLIFEDSLTFDEETIFMLDLDNCKSIIVSLTLQTGSTVTSYGMCAIKIGGKTIDVAELGSFSSPTDLYRYASFSCIENSYPMFTRWSTYGGYMGQNVKASLIHQNKIISDFIEKITFPPITGKITITVYGRR